MELVHISDDGKMVKVCLKAPYSGARGQGKQEDRREEQGSTKP